MNASIVLPVALALLGAFASPLQSQHKDLPELPGPPTKDMPEIALPLEMASPLELAMRLFDETGEAQVVGPPNPGSFTIFPFGHAHPVLRCAALKLCQVELEPGEVLVDDPLSGDLERWDVDRTASGRTTVVVVKPKACDISTNLLIVTNRRRYVVDLEAPECDGTNPAGGYMPGIRFWYPGEEPEIDEEPEAPDGFLVDVRDLDTNYRWQTNRGITWNPVRVFDDGVRTIIQFGPDARNGEMPVLYGVADDGTRVQVNSIVRPDPAGDYLIADRVLRRGALVLRDGNRERRLNVDNLTLQRR